MFRFACLFFALVLGFVGSAWSGTVSLVLSEREGVYAEFASALTQALGGSAWSITSTTYGDTPSTATTDLVVTVGSDAFRRALARGDHTPIVATLLPRISYDRLLAEVRRPAGRTTAIYLDQPPARQAAFLRHLLPGQKRVGMLFSNETRHFAAPYRQALANVGLTLESEDSDTDSTLLPALNTLLGRVGALVALPDSQIYRRNNIKTILVSSFRYQRPVIGYSAAFVNAGALAALHTTPTQIARQTAELIVAGNTNNLPPPSAPNQFAIAINQSVAQSLGLDIPDEAALRRAMLGDKEGR